MTELTSAIANLRDLTAEAQKMANVGELAEDLASLRAQLLPLVVAIASDQRELVRKICAELAPGPRSLQLLGAPGVPGALAKVLTLLDQWLGDE